MYKFVLSVMLCVAVIEARSVSKRQSLAYVLPAGAEEIVGEIKTTFQCADKIYGYYADIDNNCQIFHVCLPLEFPDGRKETFTYSFFCGNQTTFNQETLVCSYPDDAIPCADAALFYGPINENFGQQVWHTTNRPVPGYSDRQRVKRASNDHDDDKVDVESN